MLLILCLKIFAVRIIDVSLGTIRTVFTVKGKTMIAATMGFIEVLVWFLIVKEALNTDETSIFVAIAYAGGFATGTFVGGKLSDYFIEGTLGIQVILSDQKDSVIDAIRKEGYAVSVMDVKGQDKGKTKYMLFIEINKKYLDSLKRLIKELDPKAFLVVNETKYVQNGFIK